MQYMSLPVEQREALLASLANMPQYIEGTVHRDEIEAWKVQVSC
jgi:hypothetical protein